VIASHEKNAALFKEGIVELVPNLS